MKNKAINTVAIIISVLTLIMVSVSLSGCGREANRVSYNISKEADNFNVMRRLTVFNTRTDRCMMQMTGRFSIQNEGNNELVVIVELDRKKGIYQKHFVYLNEWTTYTVEDLNGVKVSKYDYELEFMPEMLVPVKITANEISEDYHEIPLEEE